MFWVSKNIHSAGGVRITKQNESTKVGVRITNQNEFYEWVRITNRANMRIPQRKNSRHGIHVFVDSF
jgi:hypothetical protein